MPETSPAGNSNRAGGGHRPMATQQPPSSTEPSTSFTSLRRAGPSGCIQHSPHNNKEQQRSGG